jgi:hypothetical protein
MQLDYVRGEIERMRVQVYRQRKDILQLQRAGICTASAQLLLARMHMRIDELCSERERLKKELPSCFRYSSLLPATVLMVATIASLLMFPLPLTSLSAPAAVSS